MRKKREVKEQKAYEKAARDIGALSKRDLFIAGLFLYWGEGLKSKSGRSVNSVSNTDPAVLKFFIKWLGLFDVSKGKLKVKLHLYSDMDVQRETDWWSKELGISKQNFNKPYIKDSETTGLSYKRKFNHGTCNVMYHNQPLNSYILGAMQRIREIS